MSPARRLRPPAAGSPPRPAGFDFTWHMRRLCDDLTNRLAPLRHVDMSRVEVGFSQTRRATAYGLHASLTPMRFAGGALYKVSRGRRWGVQRLFDESGREMLYILNFYLPRFLDLPFREKLTTVVHELWHFSPTFDGDVRRHAGRCFAHGFSQKAYDAHVERLVARWLGLNPPPPIYTFLHDDFRQLSARHGRIIGRKVPVPKLIPLE